MGIVFICSAAWPPRLRAHSNNNKIMIPISRNAIVIIQDVVTTTATTATATATATVGIMIKQ